MTTGHTPPQPDEHTAPSTPETGDTLGQTAGAEKARTTGKAGTAGKAGKAEKAGTAGKAGRAGASATAAGERTPAEGQPAVGAAAAAGSQSGGREHARRRRIGLIGVLRTLLGVVLAGVCAYALICALTLAQAQRAFGSGDHDRTVRLSERFEALTPLEHHKPPFNIGTVAAAEQRYDAAQPLLEVALSRTPPRDECAVRLNLAYVYEQQALGLRDSTDVAAANEKFDAATTTLDDAPEECQPQGSAAEQHSEQAKERIRQAQEEMNDPQSGEDGGEEKDGNDSGGDDAGDDSGQDDGKDGGSGGEGDQSGGDSGDQQGTSGADDGPETEEQRKARELEERNRDAGHRQQDEDSGKDKSRESGTKPW